MADTAVLNLGLNSNQFDRGLASAGAKLGAFSAKSILAIGAIGGVMVAGAAAISFSLIKSASDAEETANKFNAVFSGMEKTANDTAKELAKSFGLSQRESQKLLGDTGDLLTGFGLGKKAALGFSKQVQELAADLTSFQNFEGGVSGASKAITKAILGEAESMKTLGVVVQQNTKQYRDNVAEIMRQTGATLQQAKAQEIFRQITVQSKNAVGDYAKTSKMFANQLKLTGKIWDDAKISVGLFLKEFLGAEGLLLKFNNNFRSLTTNIQGFLANWKSNFGRVSNWITDSWSTMLLVDLPNLISLSIKNMIINYGQLSKGLAIIWLTVGNDISSAVANGFTKGLEIALGSFGKFADNISEGVKLAFSGNFKDFLPLIAGELFKGINALTGNEETTAQKLSRAVQNALDIVEFKGITEGFESATKDFEGFDLKITDKFKKDLDDAKKEIAGAEDKAGVKSKSTKASGGPAGAVLKDSAQAFQIQYGDANELIQKDQLKFAKKTAKNTEKLGTTTFNVASFA